MPDLDALNALLPCRVCGDARQAPGCDGMCADCYRFDHPEPQPSPGPEPAEPTDGAGPTASC
jgi:hypothetical protein